MFGEVVYISKCRKDIVGEEVWELGYDYFVTKDDDKVWHIKNSAGVDVPAEELSIVETPWILRELP